MLAHSEPLTNHLSPITSHESRLTAPGGGVAPQILQRVKFALIAVKNMHQYVGVIDDYPLAGW